MRFSANLGFLWTDRSLPEAIRAAKIAGFDAVECHWPYETSASEVWQALADTELSMLGLNTRRGSLKAGENGLAALVGREQDAQAAIDEAIDYACKIDALNIHVMGGMASGKEAEGVFVENLRYACRKAARVDKNILIEPLNNIDVPGYFLTHLTQARRIVEKVGADNLKLMFDCYHVQIMEGDLSRNLTTNLDIIGHIQFASVPDRGRPDQGEINYRHIFSHIAALGYNTPLGAEYKPAHGDTEASLGWLQNIKRSDM